MKSWFLQLHKFLKPDIQSKAGLKILQRIWAHSMYIFYIESIYQLQLQLQYDAIRKLTLSDTGDNFLDVVEKFKLLGVIIRSDMKWYDNTDYICQKGYERLWMLRRLKGLGASEDEILDVYEKQVRSVLELAVPVWQPGVSQQEVRQN